MEYHYDNDFAIVMARQCIADGAIAGYGDDGSLEYLFLCSLKASYLHCFLHNVLLEQAFIFHRTNLKQISTFRINECTIYIQRCRGIADIFT